MHRSIRNKCDLSFYSGPKEPYELRGDVDNVVFPGGYTIAPDRDTLHLYYGAADSSTALATGSVLAILTWREQQP